MGAFPKNQPASDLETNSSAEISADWFVISEREIKKGILRRKQSWKAIWPCRKFTCHSCSGTYKDGSCHYVDGVSEVKVCGNCVTIKNLQSKQLFLAKMLVDTIQQYGQLKSRFEKLKKTSNEKHRSYSVPQKVV